MLVLMLSLAQAVGAYAADNHRRGARIYRNDCARCHGDEGQGVPGKYDEALEGTRALDSLARLIARTMPEDKKEKCSPEDAQAVAAYIHAAFYSPEARAKRHPVRADFARLTNRQFRESIADLLGSFVSVTQATRPGGLRAEYFQSKGMNKKDKKVLERVDGSVDFDFGEGSPMEGITADQFSIAWAGSLMPTESGVHEFRLSTPNGARLYLNSELLAGDSNRRDDSDARRQDALIDLWVSSGGETREGAARVYLLGGRSYPLRVDYFKFKEKRASVRLEWKPPHGAWTVVPAESLSTENSSRIAVVSASFPADDGSQGYERGVAITKEWQEAVSRAAVEMANHVAGRLGTLAGAGEGASNRVEKLKEFTARLAERAFRRPLGAETRRLYVERPFEGGVAPEVAIKRAVVGVLTSPRFLYPEVGGPLDDHARGARLALQLWDSIPDQALREAAGQGELSTPEQVRAQARRMLEDPRARTKLLGFFHHWLKVEEGLDLSKDAKAYPEFTPALISDLRVSLDHFVQDVVWSEGSDYRQLLLADYLFVNPRMARFYGLGSATNAGFTRVTFDPIQRAGVVTHPYLLATFAYHKSSSPIHRGVFLTRNVLGRSLKPPPMAIEFMDDRFDPSLTMREKVTQLTSKEACMGCHATINPLGFALENFDAAGRYRTEDNRKPVDATSDYTTAGGEVLHFQGPRDVARHAAEDPLARRGFVRQLFQHAVKQPPAAFGPDTVVRLDEAFVRSGHHIRNLLVEIVTLASMSEAGLAQGSRTSK